MRRQSLPYVIVGGIKFYERKEVKDVLAYLKLAVNPSDEVSLRRVINVPGRGIGETTVMRLAAYAREQGLTLLESLGKAGMVPGLGPGVRQALGAFKTLLDNLRTFSQSNDAEETAKQAVEATGYLEYLKDQYPDPEEQQNRLENVYELVSAADDFCQRSEDKSLSAFLAEVSLIADIDRWNQGAEAVTLMTMHNAKGLEFDHVHIVGLEDGLLPHSASLESQAELEEERRLFYVAITRARKTLEMLYARSRRRYGGLLPSTPSRFLAEVPSKLVRAEAVRRQDEDVPDSTDYGTRQRVKGVKVRHPVWGVGTVVEAEGEGDDMKLSIIFAGGMRKKVMAGFVEPVR
jgi:DNA helicase-2/ATP-dependent DNA helicase PcrA